MRALVVGIYIICGTICLQSARSFAAEREVILAAAAQAQPSPSDAQNAKEPSAEEAELSPEETMQRRFPQPVKVGDLIGLPVLDDRDSTIGYVRQVVRTPEGKIQLIVPYQRWFGWVRYGGIFDLGRRLVPVPLEVVVIMGRQLAALDMSREEFDGAPTWTTTQGTPISAADTIRIAVGKR